MSEPRRAAIRRTMDPARLNAIANDPDVRPSIGGVDPIDLEQLLANPANVALESRHGGFVAVQQEPGVYEVHSIFLPAGRGSEAVAAMQAGLAYMFTRTDCFDLLTRVPDDNPAALALARAGGFAHRFTRKKQWPIAGGPTDVAFLGLDLWSWVKRAPETIAAGEWFHQKLTAAKEAAGSELPVHDDDEPHDRAAGAAVLMARGGNPVKAVNFYNRWARFAGYAPIVLISANPIVLDVLDAVVTVRGDDMEVLKCR